MTPELRAQRILRTNDLETIAKLLAFRDACREILPELVDALEHDYECKDFPDDDLVNNNGDLEEESQLTFGMIRHGRWLVECLEKEL